MSLRGRFGPRSFPILVCTVLAWLAMAVPAVAQETTGDITVISGDTVTVGPDESVDFLLVFEGDAIIDGRVSNVFALSGDVTVNGRVRDTAIAVNGLVTVSEGGVVGGDVYSSEEPVIASGGTVAGTATRIAFDEIASGVVGLTSVLFWLAFTLALLVLAAVVVALAPRAVAAIDRAGTQAAGPSIVTGLGFAILLPLVIVGFAVTLFGIPFALWLTAVLITLGGFGYLAAGRIVGGLILRDSPMGAALLGVTLLQIVSAIPVLSLLAPLASMYGLGAIAVAFWRTRTAATEPPQRVAPPPSPVSSA